MRDAVFGRQRYWGEPIPVNYKDDIPHVMPENELHLVLPEVDKYLPTEDGEPPLARAKDWKYKGQYDYEWTTMPGWAGSSWYFLRYMDAHNDAEFASKKLTNYWKEVDLYIGGSEHATGHLLYVRFWTKALKDLGYIATDEPAKKLVNQGMIQGVSAFVYGFGVGIKYTSTGDIRVPKMEKLIVPKSSYDNFKKNGSDPLLNEITQSTLQELRHQGYTGVEQSEELTPLVPVHVNIDLVNPITNELNIEEFKKSDRYNSLLIDSIICEKDGKYIVGREVEKMSKSKYNVITPDNICDDFGADTLRMYEMFLGPLEQSKPWNTNGITGVHGFLKKLWRLFYNTGSFAVTDIEPTKAELKALHKSIKKITEDIERFSFNTSVSNFMILVNELTDLKCNKSAILEPLFLLLTPHDTPLPNAMWNQLGHKESITFAPFPICNEAFLVEDNFAYPISFNGKMRFNIELPLTLSAAEIEKIVMEAEQTHKYLEGKTPKKVIVVPKKIVNIVM